jgi:hypothetical protein
MVGTGGVATLSLNPGDTVNLTFELASPPDGTLPSISDNWTVTAGQNIFEDAAPGGGGADSIAWDIQQQFDAPVTSAKYGPDDLLLACVVAWFLAWAGTKGMDHGKRA